MSSVPVIFAIAAAGLGFVVGLLARGMFDDAEARISAKERALLRECLVLISDQGTLITVQILLFNKLALTFMQPEKLSSIPSQQDAATDNEAPPFDQTKKASCGRGGRPEGHQGRDADAGCADA